jgi:hypothetical protein
MVFIAFDQATATMADFTPEELRLAEVVCSWLPACSVNSSLYINSLVLCILDVQPQPIEESTLEAWYMDDSDADQRLPHK